MSVRYCSRCKDSRCPGKDESDACENEPRSWEQAATEALERTGASTHWPAIAPAIPVARVRALVALLFPEEMTPTAKRLIESVCDEYEV